MTNEQLAERILELLEPRYCKPCQGRGEYEDYSRKHRKYFMKQCSACDGRGQVDSFFAQELKEKLNQFN